jgi:hypothetical protein
VGEFNFSDIVYVPIKCEDCKKEGQAPTLKQILDNKETKLSQTLEELGYIPVTCGCANEETTEE